MGVQYSDKVKKDARLWQRLRALLYVVGALLAFWNLRDFQWHPVDVSLFTILLLLVWTETCPLCGAWLPTPNVLRLALGAERCSACKRARPDPGDGPANPEPIMASASNPNGAAHSTRPRARR